MYCSSCGKPVDETDKFCFFCGAPVEMIPKSRVEKSEKESEQVAEIVESYDETTDDSGKEENEVISTAEVGIKEPGNPLFSSDDLNEMRKQIVEVAGKVSGAVSATATNGIKAVSDSLNAGKKEPENTVLVSSPASGKKGSVNKKDYWNNHMSKKELWTCLKKDSKRQQFFTEEVDNETEEEYMEELGQKIQENKLPATIRKRQIQWDRSGAAEELYFVIPYTNVANPLSCIVQFSHVGKFTYVEEKTFITPPNLPAVPNPPKPVDREALSRSNQLMTLGVGAFLLGIAIMSTRFAMSMAGILSIAGIGMAFLGFTMKKRVDAVIEYNTKCAKEKAAWDRAWEKWYDTIFTHAFQEDINGQLSRTFDAVLSTIHQLNDEKYKNRQMIEDSTTNDMAELDRMIKLKRQEYR